MDTVYEYLNTTGKSQYHCNYLYIMDKHAAHFGSIALFYIYFMLNKNVSRTFKA